MNRRNFLRSIMGIAAATALPSEVWPFRKIFLPPTPEVGTYNWFGTSIVRPSLMIKDVEALEMEFYRKEIPNLLRIGFPTFDMYDVGKKLYIVDGGMVENVMKEFNRGLDKVLS